MATSEEHLVCAGENGEYIVQLDDNSVSLAYRPMSLLPDSVLSNSLCASVTKLDLTETYISNLAQLSAFRSLEVLIVDKNELSDLKSCPVMKNLHTFWCNNNLFQDLEELLDAISTKFPQLRYLSIMRNPCSPGLIDVVNPDLEAIRLNRLYTLYKIPSLKMLDCCTVSQQERKEAAIRGQYAVKRRPSRVVAAVSGASADARDSAVIDSGMSKSDKQWFGPSLSGSSMSASDCAALKLSECGLFIGLGDSTASTTTAAVAENSCGTDSTTISRSNSLFNGKLKAKTISTRNSEGNRFIVNNEL